jgi:cell division protein FtsA
VVYNRVETFAAIERALRRAEEQAGNTVSEAWCGVRGQHLQSFNSKGSIRVGHTDRPITSADVDAVIADVSKIELSRDRQYLHIAPISFIADDRRCVGSPVGVSGKLLKVDAHLFTASGHLSNLLKAMPSRIGKIVPMVGILAAGELLISPERKNHGCVLLDIGGQSTLIAAYCDGAIVYSAEIPYGSDLITRDIAIALKTSFATAEKLKLKFGISDASAIKDDSEIDVGGEDGGSPQRVALRRLAEVIAPRIEEIFSMVSEKLQDSGYYDVLLPGDAVLTGGGALLRGMCDAVQKYIGMPASLGLPTVTLEEKSKQWLSPEYSTALGLLHVSNDPRWGSYAPKRSSQAPAMAASIPPDTL